MSYDGPRDFRLTFDDGPNEVWTPALLDVLFEHDVQATFFVVGAHCIGQAALLCRTLDEGHTVGVHGLTHRRLTELPDHEVRIELLVVRELVEQYTDETPVVWRAPYFAADARVLAIAETLGLRHLAADVVPDDWMAVDAEAIAATVLDELRPGSVVCLHDGIPSGGGSEHCTVSRQPTVDAVRMILERLA